jgi:predicted DNA-binding ribbon-helix-helix protein
VNGEGVLRKRSITLAGHPTSLALEPEFWATLEAMARAERASVAALIARIDRSRAERPLASACRVAALHWALSQGAAQEAFVRASAAG